MQLGTRMLNSARCVVHTPSAGLPCRSPPDDCLCSSPASHHVTSRLFECRDKSFKLHSMSLPIDNHGAHLQLQAMLHDHMQQRSAIASDAGSL